MSSHHTLDLELLARQATSVRALARALVHDELEAEELAQESLVVAMERPPRNAESLRAWLATVVRRLVLDRRRAEARRRAREELVARAEGQESHAVAVERLELEHRVLEEVLALREPYRTAVYLRFWEGLEPAAIAARLEIPVKTVKSRLSRAFEELRRKLDARFGGERRAWLPGLVGVARLENGASGVAGAAAGVWFMKQSAVVLVLVAAAWLVWIGIRSRPTLGVSGASAHETLALEANEPAGVPSLQSPTDVTVRTDPGSRPVAVVTFGALVVRLSFADGRPAADVSIDALCNADQAPREEFYRRRTDREGRVEFPELWPGKVSLLTDRGPRFLAEVTVGERREAAFSLPAGVRLEGTVLGPGGQAIAGAAVWIDGFHMLSPRPHLACAADAQGRFEIEAVDPDTRVGARAEGFCPSPEFTVSELQATPSGSKTVKLRLGANGGSVEGRVLDPAGQPVHRALVKVGERGLLIVEVVDGAQGRSPGPVLVETDSDGRFHYPGALPSGTQSVSVSARGWPIWSQAVEVREGETTRVEVRLSTPAVVEGRVLDRKNKALEGATVVATHETGGGWRKDDAFPPPRAKTNGEGRFRLDWMPAGEQELIANVPSRSELGRADAKVQCVEGETVQVDLVLDPGMTISGRVVNQDGDPLAGWMVNAEAQPEGRGAFPRPAVRTNDEGRFVVSNLEDGYTYRLEIRPQEDFGGPERASTDDISPGTTDAEIVVEDVEPCDSTVRGRVQGTEGISTADLRLAFHAQGSSHGYFIEFDPESGEFESKPMRPGRYVLSLVRGMPLMTVFRTEPFDLARGETKDVGKLVPPVLGRAEIVLAGIPSEEVEHLAVFLRRTDTSPAVLEWASGVFRSPPIPPGEWQLGMKEPWLVRKNRVTVRSGETTRFEFTPERGFWVRIACTLADRSAPWSTLSMRARDGTGECIEGGHDWLRDMMQGGRLDLWGLILPPGSWTIEVSTDTGLSGKQVVEVGASEAPAKPLEIVVR